MTQYLGISMVVIVVALCIGILSTIVTENVLRQFEASKKRQRSEMAKLIANALEGGAKYAGQYLDRVKGILEDERYKKILEEKEKEVAKEAFDKTFAEMKRDFKDELND